MPHPLTNIEIQKYFQNEPTFNGVYSKYNLPKNIKDEACVINLDGYADFGTHWINLYVSNNDLFILTVLKSNMFLKKLNVLLEIKA